MSESFWRRCNMCKNQIDYGQKIYECSVSTCRQKRTGMVFCSLGCWEAHLPMMRHRDAWAEEDVAPSQADVEAAAEAERAKTEAAKPASGGDPQDRSRSPVPSVPSAPDAQRRVVASPNIVATDDLPKDVLVVVSKLKKYIRARSGMNTAEDVLAVLSDQIRQICNRAITHAAEDGRKTVKGRDFSKSV